MHILLSGQAQCNLARKKKNTWQNCLYSPVKNHKASHLLITATFLFKPTPSSWPKIDWPTQDGRLKIRHAKNIFYKYGLLLLIAYKWFNYFSIFLYCPQYKTNQITSSTLKTNHSSFFRLKCTCWCHMSLEEYRGSRKYKKHQVL